MRPNPKSFRKVLILATVALTACLIMALSEAAAGSDSTGWTIAVVLLAIFLWCVGLLEGYTLALSVTPWVGPVTDKDLDKLIRHCRSQTGDRKVESEEFVVTQTWMRQMTRYAILHFVRLDPTGAGYAVEDEDAETITPAESGER
jgi:hypothetical protein